VQHIVLVQNNTEHSLKATAWST